MAKYYGANAGQQLTTMLKEHISIAADLVKAAKAGDKTVQGAADKKWQDNAVQIADFLSKANPNWPRATLVDMMKMHLSTTTKKSSHDSPRIGTRTCGRTTRSTTTFSRCPTP